MEDEDSQDELINRSTSHSKAKGSVLWSISGRWLNVYKIISRYMNIVVLYCIVHKYMLSNIRIGCILLLLLLLDDSDDVEEESEEGESESDEAEEEDHLDGEEEEGGNEEEDGMEN